MCVKFVEMAMAVTGLDVMHVGNSFMLHALKSTIIWHWQNQLFSVQSKLI